MSFVSSVTFDLSLKDLIQGLGDTSLVLVEGWDGGASGRVKFQLPSFGFRHVWGTTYIPSSLWKQAVASLGMPCMISDPDWFHPFSCPASPETSLVSLGEFFFSFAALCLHWRESMVPHSSTLAWKIPWMEEPGRLQCMGSLRVRHDWATSLSLFTFMHWRRKWQPLQCSCLEDPRDRGAYWAAISGVAQSWTWLKWLSSS